MGPGHGCISRMGMRGLTTTDFSLLFRIALGLAFVKLLVSRQYKLFEQMVGLLYALLGMMFLG